MATEKNIVMKEFNGTDYDTLYPKTIGTQVDGIFTAEQTLTSNTKAFYGLGTNAVPDDVFAWLGKYNQYWWKKRSYVEASGYEEKQTAATATVDLLYANDNTTTNKISYSDSISINQSTGTVSLKNPSTVTLSYNKYSESELINLFAGKYIKGAKDSPLTIYLVGAKIGQTPLGTNGNLLQNVDSDSETGRYIRITSPGLKVITSQTVTTQTIGDWSYLQSSDRNAYPDSGITDGYEYVYLGKPYENFVDVGPEETRSGMHLIRSTTTTAESNSVNIVLSDIDWSNWYAVHIDVLPICSTSSKAFSVLLGGNTSYSFGTVDGNTASSTSLNALNLVLYPSYHANRYVTGILYGSDGATVRQFSLRFSASSSVLLKYSDTTYTFKPGTAIKIWGER